MPSSNQPVNQSVGLPEDYIGKLQGFTMQQLETERAQLNKHIQYNLAAFTRAQYVVQTSPSEHNRCTHQNIARQHGTLVEGFGLMIAAIEREIQSRNEALSAMSSEFVPGAAEVVLETLRTNATSALPWVVYRLHVDGSPNTVTLALWGRDHGYAITVNEVHNMIS